MGWVRVDDAFYDHPRLIGLSMSAIGMWVTLLAWANRNLTDGAIPKCIPERFGDPMELAELLERGLLEEADEGWQIRDYHDYQPRSEDVQSKRSTLSEVRAEAGRKGALTRWNRQTDGKPIANAWQTDSPNPNPKEKEHGQALTQSTGWEADFVAWWTAYPRHVHRARALAAYRARRRDGATAEELHAAAVAYAAQVAGREPRYVLHGSSFLAKDGPWTEVHDTEPEAWHWDDPASLPR